MKAGNIVYLDGIKRELERLLYWQIEMNGNLLTGYVSSILPNNYMTESMFNIARYVEKLGEDANELCWERLYTEASERARKKHFEDNK